MKIWLPEAFQKKYFEVSLRSTSAGKLKACRMKYLTEKWPETYLFKILHFEQIFLIILIFVVVGIGSDLLSVEKEYFYEI